MLGVSVFVRRAGGVYNQLDHWIKVRSFSRKRRQSAASLKLTDMIKEKIKKLKR